MWVYILKVYFAIQTTDTRQYAHFYIVRKDNCVVVTAEVLCGLPIQLIYLDK